jgi:glucosamine-6-phosphate deaminase
MNLANAVASRTQAIEVDTRMKQVVARDSEELAELAAEDGAGVIRAAIAERGEANVVFATGNSQQQMLRYLTGMSDIHWERVIGFHLDEYLGLNDRHPASFCRYLRERLTEIVPIGKFHWIDGSCADARRECLRLSDAIARHPLDLAFIGIGENGHLAFNDPPADFDTRSPYVVVDLDERCRRQQVGEGWFARLEDVPRQAITMSIQQILSASTIVCTVPDSRKAEAVSAAFQGPLTPEVPASILRRHANATVYLDPDSAALLHRPSARPSR